MEDEEQVRSYVKAYEWGGPTSALQLHHLQELSRRIRPGDTVLDLACGPGPLLLELAPLYPDVNFIGADLSETMLRCLEAEAMRRGIRNIVTVQEDIRDLSSLANRRVDLVISTSALHHLPNEDDLRQVFRKTASLLSGGGGFYFFDFGLLRSRETRRLCVAEVAKLAPPTTARDYAFSLDAAFPIKQVMALAGQELPRPFTAEVSVPIDFFYFLHSPACTVTAPWVQKRLDLIWKMLPTPRKTEHGILRWLRRHKRFAPNSQ